MTSRAIPAQNLQPAAESSDAEPISAAVITQPPDNSRPSSISIDTPAEAFSNLSLIADVPEARPIARMRPQKQTKGVPTRCSSRK